MNISISRALITMGAATSALLFSAGIASAHVTVVAPGAEQGGMAVLTFRVPTESAAAGTTKITVDLPPVLVALTEPIPGWQSSVDRRDGTVSVTWTADPGVSVGPGHFQQFVLAAGPLPQEEQVSFATTQTYSDGTVVEWNQPVAANGDEPERPAPTLTLAEGDGDGGHDHGQMDEATETAAANGDHEEATDNTARYLGGTGLALGALGAALGIGAVVRSRKS